MLYPLATRPTSAGSACGRAAWALKPICVATGVATLLWSGGAAAAEPGGGGPSEVVFIAQIIALVLVGRLLGEAMQRIGQPAVMGQLVAGLLLGPSVLGVIWPDGQHMLFPDVRAQKSMIDGLAQLGVLMLLLLTGMETDLALVKRVRRAAASVSATGIVVPFTCGVGLGWLLPDAMLPDPGKRLITCLFLGTALSISSVKIVAMVVREVGFLRRNVGQVIVASAIIDDTIGWVIIAITFGLAQHGTVDLASVGKSVLGTVAFLAVSFTIGRRIVFRIIRWTNDNFVGEVPVITMILVIMGGMALVTQFIGVHTVLGAFVAGILVGDSPILTRHIEGELRGLITALFMPVFFGLSGLQANLTILADWHLLALTIGLILVASVGKFVGAFVGAGIGGMSRAEAMALAAGMNARGSTEVIVATIGLSMGVLTHDLFTMIVAMAIVTTMAMPPMLRWALVRLPMGEEERQRLEREESEARSFLPNLERLLVTVDASPTGRLAARLAGLTAGSRGMPTTVLDLAPEHHRAVEEVSGDMDGATPRTSEDAVRAAASEVSFADDPADPPEPVDVMTVVSRTPHGEAVATEAAKGYDLLFAGLEPTFDRGTGEFGDAIVRIADQYKGPLALVVARGTHHDNPLRAPLNILVPVNGTEPSRRAAEIAITLARAANAPVTAVTVSSGAVEGGGRLDRSHVARRNEQAILWEVENLAERQGVALRTAVRVRGAAEEAILRQARRGSYTLIVLGVGRRPGDNLHFGSVAAAILERAGQSLLLVAA